MRMEPKINQMLIRNHYKSSRERNGRLKEIIGPYIREGAVHSNEDFAEAYVCFLKHWQKLPGSIITTSTDITLQNQSSPNLYNIITIYGQIHNDTGNGGYGD
jgi:hypothetical protein